MSEPSEIERQLMEVDIACVGFGPAVGGFLSTLCRAMLDASGQPVLGSRVVEGMPLQIVCHERAAGLGFGVSGVVTRARGIRSSFPEQELSQIPMAHPVASERLVYLLDPVGASRRSRSQRIVDRTIRALRGLLPYKHDAVEVPYIPPFLRKEGGLVLAIGQFNQWVGEQVMASGQVQLWPGMPIGQALMAEDKVMGVRLLDQGTDRAGKPEAGFLPGMDIHAALTVVGDGPVGPVGRQLDEHFGLPAGHHQDDWAVGMKMVVELPQDCSLEPGTVFHTLGFPEPEIFGFLYVYPERMAALGIFVPSWLDSPVRNAYRYLQHWMLHPYLWRYLKSGKLRSWGAKSLQESGRRGEPFLVGDGYARIGEGSGSTNVLTGSGVDEAWTTGVLLAEGVIDLWQADEPFTRENLERAYVQRRRQSWVEKEGRAAERARDGFQRSFFAGLLGMGLAGLTGGRLSVPAGRDRTQRGFPSLREYYRGRIPPEEIERIRTECMAEGRSLHDALMARSGWPEIPYDGQLLVSHQDALLLGGKVQAPPGYADHIVFLYPHICETCENKLCVEICSGQAITPGEQGVPLFDREKCVHCGACVWSCTQSRPGDRKGSLIELRAGAGGLHSAEN